MTNITEGKSEVWKYVRGHGYSGECNQCSATVWKYLPEYKSRNLCMTCLNIVEPFWQEKQLHIKVIEI